MWQIHWCTQLQCVIVDGGGLWAQPAPVRLNEVFLLFLLFLSVSLSQRSVAAQLQMFCCRRALGQSQQPCTASLCGQFVLLCVMRNTRVFRNDSCSTINLLLRCESCDQCSFTPAEPSWREQTGANPRALLTRDSAGLKTGRHLQRHLVFRACAENTLERQ